jgi:hypothetical protein
MRVFHRRAFTDEFHFPYAYPAVLVNNDSLFIVNGINSQFTTTSTPIVLNISNPRAITYMQTYTDPNINSVENRTSLSSGAIAGIAVGASIAVSS